MSLSRLSITISLCALNPSIAICLGLSSSVGAELVSDILLSDLLELLPSVPSSFGSECDTPASFFAFLRAFAAATATGSKHSPAWYVEAHSKGFSFSLAKLLIMCLIESVDTTVVIPNLPP
ncbi:hypothetical protein V8G54_024415 [Vigna mungo]|uniref:Secreted protein n=1 Tax=Vigna mungo TaxID=3915 RepID=A0AAQ3RQ37_VIGMU